jgi:hypothetical protein
MLSMSISRLHITGHFRITSWYVSITLSNTAQSVDHVKGAHHGISGILPSIGQEGVGRVLLLEIALDLLSRVLPTPYVVVGLRLIPIRALYYIVRNQYFVDGV